MGPKTTKVYETRGERLASGQYAAGDKFPSERTLPEELGCLRYPHSSLAYCCRGAVRGEPFGAEPPAAVIFGSSGSGDDGCSVGAARMSSLNQRSRIRWYFVLTLGRSGLGLNHS